MDLRHLRAFVTAAECENFTRAGELLEVSQAAVSKQVAALEEDLGVVLFERTGRHVVPSEAGKRFYPYARQILDLAEQARRDLGQAPAAGLGTLRLAASSVPAEWLLPGLLEEFRALHADAQITVDVSDSAGATQSVETGQADVGIVGELPRSEGLVARPIAADELVLIASPKHPLAQQKRVTLKQLGQQQFIVREPGSGSRRSVEEALAAAGLAPQELAISLEMNSNEAIRAAVERDMGLAFQSRHTIEHEVAEGRLVPIPVERLRIRRQLYAITAADRIATPAVRAFMEFLDKRGVV